MKAFLVGNSICNGLEQDGWTVIALPGADWLEVGKYILDRIHTFVDSFVYIHVGPVRFTKMERGRHRREVALVRPHTRQLVRDYWADVILALARCRSVPVLCTLYPMDFWRCNLSYSHAYGSNPGRLVLQDSYDTWNRRIRGIVVIENRGIVDCNERNGVFTPFVHKAVFLRRRGTYVFRGDRFLEDGIHPTRYLKSEWRRELRRVHMHNLRKHHRRH